jgi:predicted GIY-YIG superfamily endonuclease
MKYVYLIQSTPCPTQRYVGITSDLNARLKSHNEGQSSHTSKSKPWKLVTYVAFSDESKAIDFEKYLKSGSGRAFAEKRLWGSDIGKCQETNGET